VAGDNRSAARGSRAIVCRCQLHQLPHDGELHNSNIRSQHDGLRAHRNARFARAYTLRFVPREQQLHAQFHSVLRLPHDGLEQYGNAGRHGSEPHHGRLSDRLLDLPFDNELDNVDV
jgi:hypothetical protein